MTPALVGDSAVLARLVLAKADDLGRPLVVGVSGFGGAGKSTLALALHQCLPGSQVVPGDEFIRVRPMTGRSDDWSSIDRQRLLEQVLLPSRRGESQYQTYDWETGTLGPWVSVSGSPVIVEGVGLFHPDIVRRFDLRVWIDVDLDTATAQGMWRDENVYHNPQTQLWEEVWKPNDADFFRRFRPDRAADIIYSLDT